MPSHSRAAPLAVSALLVLGCAGTDDEGASTTSGEEVALFDSSVVHEIAVEFDTDEYDALIETFADTGEKTWMEVTVTIDGVVFEEAGMRLKGNSSLAGLGGGPGGGRAAPPGGVDAGGLAGASADSPEGLPWLIRLDEFVEGQTHQGYEDIVVRSNGSATALNEAVALDLLDEAGLASQEAVSTSFTVNGGDPVLRLAIEHPDDDAWQERAFDGAGGALYKAESTGDWSYRGDDPDEYTEVFDQEGGSDLTDLTPLIDFLQFLDEASDEDFAAGLADRLDVDAFARYLAMMELVDNFDDIDGPGNNAYLWYDLETQQFTVVPWDMNLAFGAIGGPGGGGPGAGGTFEPPEGIELPEGFDPENLPEGFPGGGPGGPGGGFGGGGNILVERFHADEELEALYQAALEDLRTSLYGSGAALDILQDRADTLTAEAGSLVDADVVAEESDAIAEQFTSED
jgi:spore coat protein CotH